MPAGYRISATEMGKEREKKCPKYIVTLTVKRFGTFSLHQALITVVAAIQTLIPVTDGVGEWGCIRNISKHFCIKNIWSLFPLWSFTHSVPQRPLRQVRRRAAEAETRRAREEAA